MTERASRWRVGQRLDAFQEMMGFAAGVICEITFGKEANSEAQVIANCVAAVFENLRDEILYLSLWQRLPFRRSQRWSRAVRTLNATINNMIVQRRSSGGESEDLLGLLLRVKDENGLGIPDEDVHDEILTMFVTGQETSAIALTWATALLAQHAEFQEEAAAEIAHVTNGRAVMAEDYPHLKFLNGIVCEVLRLYPPLWAIGRSSIRDTTIGKLRVRSGTELWIPIYQIHRDARWFSDPERFDPYRWIDSARRLTYAYFPFGRGLRSCIAQHFAMAQLVLGLAVILSRFRFRLEPGTKLETEAWLTLRPKNGMPVVVSAR